MSNVPLEIVFEGNMKDIPEEYSKMIVEQWNKIVQHRIENPDKWYPINTHPHKYHLITSPFELNGKRPYISDVSEVTQANLNKEVVYEIFAMDDEDIYNLEFESRINPSYWELHGDIYEMTGNIIICRHTDK